MSGRTIIHLRSETKPLEHRSALTPSTAKALVEAGYTVHVERSPVRIFSDGEFEAVGCVLVDEHSWPNTPSSHIILGLKELEEKSFPLRHTHVQFAHCYKGQAGWEQVLSRFTRGGGTLLDLEFLQDEKGRRVAAFGYHAGFAGAALAIKAWGHQLANKETGLPAVTPYENEELCLEDVKEALQAGMKQSSGRQPRALVIGALGRCGRGAVELCRKVGLHEENILQWDMAETAKGGPFDEIIESDMFINCIYLSEPIAPFVDLDSLNAAGQRRKLSVVCDVSCDTTNPHNPIPIYSVNTTFDNPTVPVHGLDTSPDPPLSVISIDHLPTLLPREASEAFSQALLPSLLQLSHRAEARVWSEAEELFRKKSLSLPETLRRREANGGEDAGAHDETDMIFDAPVVHGVAQSAMAS